MSHRPSKTIILGGVAALVIALALCGVLGTVARVVIALPFVLVAPGYAIVAAVFPKRGLGGVETLLFSIGVSVAVATLGGLALNWTPWGLRTEVWVVFLAAVALGAGGVAIARRGGLSTTLPVARLPHTGSGPILRVGVPLLATALVLAVATGVSVTGAIHQPRKGFTQLWILPASGHKASAVRLGLANRESATTRYLLRLTAGGHTVREWRALNLTPGASWQATVTLPTSLARVGKVEAILSRASSPCSVYRRVWYSVISGN